MAYFPRVGRRTVYTPQFNRVGVCRSASDIGCSEEDGTKGWGGSNAESSRRFNDRPSCDLEFASSSESKTQTDTAANDAEQSKGKENLLFNRESFLAVTPNAIFLRRLMRRFRKMQKGRMRQIKSVTMSRSSVASKYAALVY
jgi:hypothetical protein